jgi:hypothetical protein
MIRNHTKPRWTYSSRRPVGDCRASFCDLYSGLAVRRVRAATGSPLSAVLARTFTTGGLLLAAWNFPNQIPKICSSLYSSKLFRQHKYGRYRK